MKPTPLNMDQLRARAVRGLTAAAVHLAGAAKETLSEPAPRERLLSRAGSVYYRATTPATPGVPPRKLTGRLRSSVSWTVDKATLRATVGTNSVYGGVHEAGNHPWLLPTFQRLRPALEALIARAMRS